MPAKARQVGLGLQIAAGVVLWSIPFGVARGYVLGRRALRFAVAAIKLGWKDGLHEPA